MIGGKVLEAVELDNPKTHERRTVQTPAVFSMIGDKPRTAWLPPEIERDENGFIKTGHAVVDAAAWKGICRSPGPLETSLPGIFAAGDVRSGSVKRCAAAVREGGMRSRACTRPSELTPERASASQSRQRAGMALPALVLSNCTGTDLRINIEDDLYPLRPNRGHTFATAFAMGGHTPTEVSTTPLALAAER